MSLETEISEKGQKKLQLYIAAMYLFDQGKSHPQIVRMLEQYEPDIQVLTLIVDKAMKEEWDKLYVEAKDLFSQGLHYNEVLEVISSKEPDSEIANWICSEWYKWKSIYVESLVDGSTNRFEGMKWIIICGIVIPVLFYIGTSWITKTIWIIAFIFSVIQWIVGMQQRDLTHRINRLFATEIQTGTEE